VVHPRAFHVDNNGALDVAGRSLLQRLLEDRRGACRT
jgi:ribose 1,5-bisphosphokinase PhnN